MPAKTKSPLGVLQDTLGVIQQIGVVVRPVQPATPSLEARTPPDNSNSHSL